MGIFPNITAANKNEVIPVIAEQLENKIIFFSLPLKTVTS